MAINSGPIIRAPLKIESGGTNNYVMTAVDGKTIQGEANLTFDGSTLIVGRDGTTGIQVSNTNASNPALGGFITLMERGTEFGAANNFGFRFLYDGSSNELKIQGANETSVVTHVTIARDSGNITLGGDIMTTGLTINQGAADDEILAFKSSDVNHPFTAKAEQDTYAAFGKVRATGGLDIVAYQDAGSDSGAMIVRAYNQDAADTGKTTSDYGLIRLLTAVSDGIDDIAAVGANGNLVSFDNLNTTRFIFDAEGSGHADIEWTTYATHDDLALVTDMEQELLLHEDEAKTERRHMLEEIGIIGEDSWHMENGKPRAMVNMTKLSMLHHGALMQAADKIKALESRLLAIEGAS